MRPKHTRFEMVRFDPLGHKVRGPLIVFGVLGSILMGLGALVFFAMSR